MADLEVTAVFASDSFTLTYAAGAHGSLTGDATQTIDYGADGTAVTAVPDQGYHFVKWSDDLTTASRTDVNVTANLSVTAEFAINTYTLTYAPGAGGSLTAYRPQTVDYAGNGSAVTAVPAAGHHFAGWSDGLLTAARTDTDVRADKSVTASFAVDAAEGQRTVLIVAPHPDDDLLYGAGVAANALARGDRVKIVYMTNGDYYDGPSAGLAREDDSVRAQTTHIGTVEDDLIFLGYPDGGLSPIFLSHPGPGDPYVTSFGQSTTYGDRGLGRQDYHSYRFGAHAAYTAPMCVRTSTRSSLPTSRTTSTRPAPGPAPRPLHHPPVRADGGQRRDGCRPHLRADAPHDLRALAGRRRLAGGDRSHSGHGRAAWVRRQWSQLERPREPGRARRHAVDGSRRQPQVPCAADS